jgi:hypothetical protein
MPAAVFDGNLETNKSRMFVGNCWDWLSDLSKPKDDPDAMDVTIRELGFDA